MSEQPKGTKPPFETWAVVELMGHVRLAGHVTEQELFGAKVGRIEIPLPGGGFATQFFGGASVYRISPVSEEVARAVALQTSFVPVNVWELPKRLAAPETPKRLYESGQEEDDQDEADEDDMARLRDGDDE